MPFTFTIQMMIDVMRCFVVDFVFTRHDEGGYSISAIALDVPLKAILSSHISSSTSSFTAGHIFFPNGTSTDAQGMSAHQPQEGDVLPRPSDHDIQSVGFLSYHVHLSLTH